MLVPMIRVASRCRSIDELVVAFATRVDEETLIVITDRVDGVGARVRFAIELDDGTVAMAGEAEIVEHRALPRGQHQVRLHLLALDAAGRAAHRRMLDRKRGVVTERAEVSRPVVRIPAARPTAAPPRVADEPPPSVRVAIPEIVPSPRARTPRPPLQTEPLRFDVDQMIALVRRLPPGDLATVLGVLRTTLASVGVTLPRVIADAQERQADLEDRMIELERQVDERRREIDARAAQIARLERDLAETTQVRERLELAERRRDGAR